MSSRAEAVQCSELLRESIVAGDLEAVRTLLNQKLQMPPPVENQLTLLWEAVRHSHFEIAELLVRFGADVDQRLGSREGYRWPSSILLELAVWSNQKAATRLGQIMIEQGADINARGGYMGDIVLNLAFHYGHLEFAEMLLREGARTSGITKANLPAILAASLSPKPKKSIELVLKYDSLIKRKSFVNGNALHCLGENCIENVEAAQLLLKMGASLSDRDEFGYTPFLRAVSTGKKKLVLEYLKHGADIDVKTPLGESAVFLAAQNLDISMLQLLLFKGAYFTDLIDCVKKVEILDLVENGRKDNHHQINKIILKELAKVEFERSSSRNLDAIWLKKSECCIDGQKVKDFYDDCLLELSKMKSKVFYKDYSYYFVLKSLRNRKSLAELTDNIGFYTEYYRQDTNKSFKKYDIDLDFIFSDALRKRDYVNRLHLIFNNNVSKDILYNVSQFSRLRGNYSIRCNRPRREEK